ncbi:glutathione S-transferase C-terminal domain-containing protein [Marinomonas transparens]|nr:glutathione S-transferase C-terminal domain-containing protein [Marinomonas transparens]
MSLWPDSLVQRNKMLAWINYNDIFFKYWLDRYKYADRFPEFDVNYYRQKAEVFLQRLDKRLSRRVFIFGDQMSLADIAIFPFIRQFSAVCPIWFDSADYPYLKRWLKVFLDSEVFNVVMVKYPAWDEGKEEIVVPWSL